METVRVRFEGVFFFYNTQGLSGARIFLKVDYPLARSADIIDCGTGTGMN